MGKKREIQDGGGQPSKKSHIQIGVGEASFPKILEDEVHINKLPEDILVWILCKLSVEEAARTSVVSRRWNKLWKKAIVVAPRLRLYSFQVKGTTGLRSDTSDNQMHKYVNRVNQVLKLHKPPTLDEFTVGYPLDSKFSQDINKWVEFAAKKQVKKLVLDFCVRIEGLDKVPSYGGFLASFGGIMFYKLTDLYLRGINVTDNVIHCLLSNSPLIERLCVIDSQGLHNLEVTASNLRYFKIRSCNDLKYLKIYAPNLNVMKLYTAAAFPRSPRHICVNSYAPNLSSLTFALTQKFSRSVSLSVSDCFHALLVQFSQVKKRLSIKVFAEAFLAITKHNVIPYPELSYVEHLKITINFPWPLWYIAGKSPGYRGLLWPSFLLKAAPSLHKLSIKLFHKEHKLTYGDIDNKWMIEDIPKEVKENVGNYSHQNLKVVELIGFTGVRYEIKLVLLLVEIAASLEKLVIRVCIPNLWWPDKDTLSYKRNQYDEFCRNSVKMLKTQIRPEIDVLII